MYIFVCIYVLSHTRLGVVLMFVNVFVKCIRKGIRKMSFAHHGLPKALRRRRAPQRMCAAAELSDAFR